MAFEFLHDIQEARMTRNKNNQRALTYNDCKERAFLLMLMIQVMRYSRKHRESAGRYAKKTVMYTDYQKQRLDSTDLYNLFYFVLGDETALGKLKDPGAAKKIRNKTSVSITKLNGFLRIAAKLDKPSKQELVYLAELERELGIQNPDYRTLRRRIISFEDDGLQERKTTVTRLLFAARAKLSDSDLINDFQRFATDANLEDLDKTNPEFDPSIPDDPQISVASVRNYRFLVGANQLPYVAKFLDNALQGRAVVANFMQSYVPILVMIDDIVKAGPNYINQLKQLHMRAKRDKSAK